MQIIWRSIIFIRNKREKLRRKRISLKTLEIFKQLPQFPNLSGIELPDN